MTAAATVTAMPELPRPGQEVRWRNPGQAHTWGWEGAFGPGPFVVVRTVDHSRHGLATGLVLRTAFGEQEISEVWLALAGAPNGDDSAGRGVPVAATAGGPALEQGR